VSKRIHKENPFDTTIPSFSQLKNGFLKSLSVSKRDDGRWIVIDSKATAYRLFKGLLIGVIGGVIVGMMMGCFPFIEFLLLPPLSFLAKIPPTAVLAVFFVLVGTEMHVTMVVFGILPSLAQSIYLAVKEVPEELIFKAYTLGASHGEVIFNIIFPQILPKMIDSIRLQIGPAMVYLIAAEMICGDEGFGYRIRIQSKLLNMDVVYQYIVILALSGYVMDYSLKLIQSLLSPWHDRKGE